MGILFVLLLVVLIVEGYIIVALNEAFGGWNTIGLIVLTSIVGFYLIKREGLGVVRRAQRSLNEGKIPTNELINGVLLLVAAAFILTPGFFTASVGLLLLFPPTRAVVREIIKHRFAVRVASGRAFGGPGIRFGRWTDANATDVTDAGEASYRDSTREAFELGPVPDPSAPEDADDQLDDKRKGDRREPR